MARWRLGGFVPALAMASGLAAAPGSADAAASCKRTITASVVVLDQPLMFNRLGAQNVNGIVYALERDVIDLDSKLPLTEGGLPVPGQVALRPDKRPRPLVLRAAAGDCLEVHLQNLLTQTANPRNANTFVGNLFFALGIDDQVADRYAGFHPAGLELAESIRDDASWVGRNESSLVSPGESRTYRFLAPKEGAFLVTSHGATFGGEGSAGNSSNGMIAVVNVEPAGASFFRSQVTEEELRLATRGETPAGQPVIDYHALYPNDCPDGVWCREGKAGLPILSMLDASNQLVHTDINAVVVGPNEDGSFPPSTYPLESVGKQNPAYPGRLEPFREFTVVFHDDNVAAQAFPGYFEDPVLTHTLHGVRDGFMINYGSGGIGAEILANRLRVGPMHDCLDCAYEEFFLSAFTVGDPAMLVDVPANFGLETLRPGEAPPPGAVGPKATRAFFPDDPSNVHHGYIGDRLKYRNLHSGKEHHVFHLHNHQWLYNPNDDNSNYIDAQGLGPGSGYTYEMVFGGMGNRNKTSGDAIFHCHFYPHFAQGMWELARNHDVLETGTSLAVSSGSFHKQPFGLQDGTPAPGARALPDGEIVAGTPIPAVVPLPGKPLPPMPGRVEVVPKEATVSASEFHPLASGEPVPVGSNAHVIQREKNPGFPFWIGGIENTVGQRPPTPPLDMLSEQQAAALQEGPNPLYAGRTDLVPLSGGHDGGLPRHTLDGYAAGGAADSIESRLDFSKRMTRARPVYLPEEGTDIEQAAMAFHAIRKHPSWALSLTGKPTQAAFVTNGRPPVPSAPYHDPCVDDEGRPVVAGQPARFFDAAGGTSNTGRVQYGFDNPRTYQAAVIQVDTVFNKAGWHYPQQRMETLWQDVLPTINKERPPEPFVIRFNTYDCGKLQHTNLIPEAFELDDYQVRTPTDVIGQHIHLPKWDLTTTDGAANGWNYEDGSLSPGAVRERIEAINAWNETAEEPVTTLDGRSHLEPEPHPFFGAGPDGSWLGARTTLERWFFDPVYNADGIDRGLGIIFTHDHFGPSTHQQIGLYGSVLTEPAGSTWRHNETGELLGTRADGGPTSWQVAILSGDLDRDGTDDSFREFWFQASDFQHGYEAGVYVGAGPDGRPNPALAPTADTFRYAIAPPIRDQADPVLPDLVVHAPMCPGNPTVPRPCPEAIAAEDPGMFVLNYRNEPVGLRVYDPNRIGPDGKPGSQSAGEAGDLAFALQTRIDRALPAFNTRLGDTPYPALTGDIRPGDPFTPMMRAFAGDRVRVRVQMGGQEEEFNTSIHGVKWLQGGSSFGAAPNSGWRNSQAHGISEQFTYAVPVVPSIQSSRAVTDYAYTTNASQDGWWTGVWGVMRAYDGNQNDLYRMPNTPRNPKYSNGTEFNEACPKSAPVRKYDVTAVLANAALRNELRVDLVPDDPSAHVHVGGPVDPDGGTLVYNRRATPLSNGKAGPLHDPTAILYVRTDDLDKKSGQLKPGVPVEPLVLRAAAGECLEITLRNRLPEVVPDLGNYTSLIGVVNRDRNSAQGMSTFNNNLIRPSSYVGLHPQLVSYDVSRADGTLVGINPPGQALVSPGGQKTFRWYAGDIRTVPDPGRPDRLQIVATPVELGGFNLIPADKVKQGQKGLVGAGVVLPVGASWTEDANGRASATVSGGTRDFAVVLQKQLGLRYADGSPVENIAGDNQAGEDPDQVDGHTGAERHVIAADNQDAGQIAVNYRTEPMWYRFGLAANVPLGNTAGGLGAIENAHQAYSNTLVGGVDPETPVFTAARKQPVRMHLVEPHGAFRGTVFTVHGHVWQRDPYVCPGSNHLGLPGRCRPNEIASRALGVNPQGFYLGGQDGVHPYSHFDVVLPSAGGANGVSGDYLFRDQAGFGNLGGAWGILRVGP